MTRLHIVLTSRFSGNFLSEHFKHTRCYISERWLKVVGKVQLQLDSLNSSFSKKGGRPGFANWCAFTPVIFHFCSFHLAAKYSTDQPSVHLSGHHTKLNPLPVTKPKGRKMVHTSMQMQMLQVIQRFPVSLHSEYVHRGPHLCQLCQVLSFAFTNLRKPCFCP